MMTPVARLIVVSATPKDKLLTAMGWFTMPALVGPLIGPPIAGLVLSVAAWPWIFYINLPVGLLGVIAVMRFVPKSEPKRDLGRFDTAGFVLSALAVSGLVIVAETAGVNLLPPWAQVTLLALSVGLRLCLPARRQADRPTASWTSPCCATRPSAPAWSAARWCG